MAKKPAKTKVDQERKAASKKVPAKPVSEAAPKKVPAKPAKMAAPKKASAKPAKMAAPKKVPAKPAKMAAPKKASAKPAKMAAPKKVPAKPAKKAAPKKAPKKAAKAGRAKISSHEHQVAAHTHEGMAPADHSHTALATKAELKSLATRVGRLETEPGKAAPAPSQCLVIGGRLDTQPIDSSPSFSPAYPFKFDLSRLGKNLDPNRLRVVASGFKKAADDQPECALMIRWSLQGTTLYLQVWDSNGNECGVSSPTPFGWYNKRVELSFVATHEA
ncbi:MAG: hypothetical protein RBU30_20460 [Polyangia bacterium]|jgi:hypothetical protein|nr:hypothetical protein [Polyangia bacterium]